LLELVTKDRTENDLTVPLDGQHLCLDDEARDGVVELASVIRVSAGRHDLIEQPVDGLSGGR
jgi:hypothetical protein